MSPVLFIRVSLLCPKRRFQHFRPDKMSDEEYEVETILEKRVRKGKVTLR